LEEKGVINVQPATVWVKLGHLDINLFLLLSLAALAPKYQKFSGKGLIVFQKSNLSGENTAGVYST